MESPYSESGDWNIILTHYFDKDGKTFAFSKQTKFFNSGCTEGVAYETINKYYDKDFKQVSREYKLVDEKNNQLNKSKCEFPYDEPYNVEPNRDFFIKSLKLKRQATRVLPIGWKLEQSAAYRYKFWSVGRNSFEL